MKCQSGDAITTSFSRLSEVWGYSNVPIHVDNTDFHWEIKTLKDQRAVKYGTKGYILANVPPAVGLESFDLKCPTCANTYKGHFGSKNTSFEKHKALPHVEACSLCTTLYQSASPASAFGRPSTA